MVHDRHAEKADEPGKKTHEASDRSDQSRLGDYQGEKMYRPRPDGSAEPELLPALEHRQNHRIGQSYARSEESYQR